MKRFLAFILSLILLFSICACKKEEPSPSVTPEPKPSVTAPSSSEEPSLPPEPVTVTVDEEFEFTMDNYPKMGGSLAALPLGEALTANALGLTREEATKLLTFDGSTTSNYERLRDGTFDIILAYEPAEEVKTEYANEFEFIPIAQDALVFITGKDNPVENVNYEDVIGIFSGETKNWADLGGNDEAIVPYMRNHDSGSQTLFDMFFNFGDHYYMGNDYIVGSMGGLLEAIANYKGTDEAIGYTVYYYLTQMEDWTLETSKILSYNGVMPSNQAIEDGTYELSQNFYVVIKKTAEKNSPERILFNWIASEQGKQIAVNEGYARAAAEE